MMLRSNFALTAGLAALLVLPQAHAAGLQLNISGALLSQASQGYLGVDIRDVSTEQISSLRLHEARGAIVCMLDHDGPAMKAGIRLDDVILQMNGQTVEGEEQLRRMLHETPAGHTVTFVISRDGQHKTIRVQLANREELERNAWSQHYAVPTPPEDAAPIPESSFAPEDNSPAPRISRGRSYPGFGFMGPMIPLSSTYTGAVLDAEGPQMAEFFGARPGPVLVVKNVDANSPAFRAGLHAGDVVTAVNDKSISSRNDWLKLVRENRGKPLTITILRDRREQVLTLQLGDGKKHSQLEHLPATWLPSGYEYANPLTAPSEHWI